MPGIGPLELVLLVVVVILLFGARKLPEMGRGLGEGIREFRRAGRELMRGSGSESSDHADE
ncbi:twin-arginine translocase TatA/TatE family subunit (plasmid) [Deinococcus sp. KNUC1210]|uniref:twin-arginine translocase TatA/TatE family subunit n=1 Tax=Deinococcus sp. KNUC1210 TaxID=2917691 RepID=UPI001EEF9051|nr:twin-arginine translocase TatA/TatE family subunit [Deinococcus sp. KNUC1210]ULH17737.1 twin-arginine translocase TatA/TatE family subunit [Deinococcus sp. KNUC1210]